jgi:hypothetical protein
MTTELLERIRAALNSGRLTVNTLDDGSGVLLDLDGEQLLTLNSSALHLVCSVESGAADIDALATALTERFEVDEERAWADAAGFVEGLAAALD